MNHSDKAGSEAAIVSDKSSPSEALGETSGGLLDKKAGRSMRRIRALEEELNALELELDLMLAADDQ
jgi:hypothetical protein